MEDPKCGNCGNYMTRIDDTEWYCKECDNYYDPTMPLPEIAYAEVEVAIICNECMEHMGEVKRWWGDKAYYGIYEHILYQCPNGHERETMHDVPVEILPFMPPGDAGRDYSEW